MYRLCYSFLGSAADAEDATQSVFMKLIARPRRFNDAEHEKAWLIVCAQNHCRDVLKSAHRTRQAVLPEDIADERRAQRDETLDAVLALPEKYKTCVYLFYYEGYRTAEIAALTGVPASTVRSHLSEARALLRRCWEVSDMDDNRFHAEESLEKRLADAYESMGPDEEARRRMLAELLAASERRAPKRRTARRALVPLAACLALAAGIGVFTYASSLPQPPSSSGMAALTSINDELKSAAPAASDESQSESGAAPSDGDARYPFVTLSSGELLRVALGDDSPLPASPETVGEELERAVATGPDETSSSPCTVFATSDPAHPYAIRYDENGVTYLADPA